MVANTFRCNDVSPAKFAFKYGANDTFEYLNRYSHYRNKVMPNVTISDVAQHKADSNAEPIVIYVASN